MLTHLYAGLVLFLGYFVIGLLICSPIKGWVERILIALPLFGTLYLSFQIFAVAYTMPFDWTIRISATVVLLVSVASGLWSGLRLYWWMDDRCFWRKHGSQIPWAKR